MHVLLTILLAHPTITDTETPDPVAAVQEGKMFLLFFSFLHLELVYYEFDYCDTTTLLQRTEYFLRKECL